MNNRIAAIIPCHNEELTIATVIRDIRATVPEAELYIFDNNSSDRTAQIARSLDAKVIREKRQGKGYVVQSMFSKIDADIYIMVDGDDTYEISSLKDMIAAVVNDEADLVIGSRLKKSSKKAFRPFHVLGNKLVRFLVNRFFKARLVDIMSGLRVMNKTFVKNINITSSGFEVETEMVIKALKYGYVIKEMEVNYRERPEGSYSKLNTIKDGLLVLKTIFIIFRDYKPLVFFSNLALFMFLVSVLSGSVVIKEFADTRYIKRVPLAIFASGSMILSFILFITGVILDSINRRFDELYNLVKIKCGPHSRL